MNTLQSKLKIVPAIDKQELLFYVAQHAPTVSIKIITDSGQTYDGVVLNVGNARNEGSIVTFQLAESRGQLSNRVLHISVHKIESIELLADENDLIGILSLGRVSKNETYETSGKLEVQRELKTFSDSVISVSGVNVGVPEITLPTDGLALNRILRLTKKIQQSVIDLLKDEDAKVNWKSNYTKIAFVDAERLEVTGNNNTVQIHFPFNDINKSEIASEELMTKLMSIL
ncbi:MAG: hypothetical protein ACKVOQ_08665 [Cyclobacteriaceae bacterium]